MENRIIFREMLTEIQTAADEAGGYISREKIRELLSGMPLEEEHFQLIYDYLAQQNIRVVESEEEVQELPEDEDRKSLSMYLEELESLDRESFEDEHTLLERAVVGDPDARNRLIEGYLPLICEMAEEYDGEELPAEDLIQEGNLGLLLAIDTLAEAEGRRQSSETDSTRPSCNPAAYRAHILNSINNAMEAAIRGTQERHRHDEGIVSRVNHLNEAVHNLERDLEHKVSAEEVSAYLEMPLEEIRDLLRMSGDQIDLDKGGR